MGTHLPLRPGNRGRCGDEALGNIPIRHCFANETSFQLLRPAYTVMIWSHGSACRGIGDTGDQDAAHIARTLDEPTPAGCGPLREHLTEVHKPTGLPLPDRQKIVESRSNVCPSRIGRMAVKENRIRASDTLVVPRYVKPTNNRRSISGEGNRGSFSSRWSLW